MVDLFEDCGFTIAELDRLGQIVFYLSQGEDEKRHRLFYSNIIAEIICEKSRLIMLKEMEIELAKLKALQAALNLLG